MITHRTHTRMTHTHDDVWHCILAVVVVVVLFAIFAYFGV